MPSPCSPSIWLDFLQPIDKPHFVKAIVTTLLIGFASLCSVQAAEIRTIAGTGVKGFSGDGGPATEAQFDEPLGVVRGPDGGLYVCDSFNQRIRRIGKDGIVTTVAGNGMRGYSGDGGVAVDASLNEPYEVRFDTVGNMYFVERLSLVVRKVDAKTQVISTVAGCGKEGFSGDGGPAIEAKIRQPHSLAIDQAGDIYFCDIGNNRIRKVDMKTGKISTIAGTGQNGAMQDGKPFAEAPLKGPRAIDFDRDGHLWVASREWNTVFELDFGTGLLRRVAGTGKLGFTGNGGPALEATLSGPKGLSVGPDGNVYFADTESHSIRMIDPKRGTIELVAGTGARGNGPDGDPLHCLMARPHGVFVDSDGTVYIGDTENHCVRALHR